MTDRLYYDQTYLTSFEATVLEVRPEREKQLVLLDRSAFYPTSGGQPFDTGTLRTGERVLSVTEVSVDREGNVWHSISGELAPGDRVTGEIDWERRFDHMQQHGGEHMLAGAVWERLRGVTQGLHLGVEDSSIDVALPDGSARVDAETVRELEELVNRRIQHNDPIRCWFPSEEELAALPLRKAPTVSEHVRIVAMGDYEMVACGGTHPARTGEIGQIHILSVTPVRGKARFTFVCGMRAARLYRRCTEITDRLSAALSAPLLELPGAVDKLKGQLADLKAELKKKEAEDWQKELESNLKPVTETAGGPLLAVCRREDGDPDAMTDAVTRMIRRPGLILLAGAGKRILLARSEDIALDLCQVIRQVAKGGGRPELATGAGGEKELQAAAEMIRSRCAQTER